VKLNLYYIGFWVLVSGAGVAEEKHGNPPSSQRTEIQDRFTPPKGLLAIEKLVGFETCRHDGSRLYRECLVLYRPAGKPSQIKFARIVYMSSPFPGQESIVSHTLLNRYSLNISNATKSITMKLMQPGTRSERARFYEVAFKVDPYSVSVKAGEKKDKLVEDTGWGDIRIESFSQGFEGWIPREASVWVAGRIANPTFQEASDRNKHRAFEFRTMLESWLKNNALDQHGVIIHPPSADGYPEHFGGVKLKAPLYILNRLHQEFPSWFESYTLAEK